MNKYTLLFMWIFSLPLIINSQNNGSFKDSRDGHDYKWILIGKQIWMAENLAYLPSVSLPVKGVKKEVSVHTLKL